MLQEFVLCEIVVFLKKGGYFRLLILTDGGCGLEEAENDGEHHNYKMELGIRKRRHSVGDKIETLTGLRKRRPLCMHCPSYRVTW